MRSLLLFFFFFVTCVSVNACVCVCVSFGLLASHIGRNNSRECVIFSMPLASLTGSVT